MKSTKALSMLLLLLPGSRWSAEGRLGDEDSSLDPVDNAGTGRQLDFTLPLSACENSAFEPDPEKYYTIAAENELVWQHGKGNLPNIPNRKLTLTDDRLDVASHWRFIPGSTAGEWLIRNRLTGMEVGTDVFNNDQQHFAITTLDSHPSNKPITFQATCSGDNTQVVLSHNDDGQEHSFRCSPTGCGEDQPIGTRINPNFQDRDDRCRAQGSVLGESCRELFGPRTFKIGERRCAFARFAFKCRSFFDDPEQQAEQGWAIEEVTKFVKRGAFEDIVVDVLDESPSATLSKTIAAVGGIISAGAGVGVTAATAGCNLCGALVGSLLSFGFGEAIPDGPSLQETLQSLADDIKSQTDDLISTANAKETIRLAENNFNARREFFLLEYPERKHGLIDRSDTEGLKDLANDLLNKVDEFSVDVQTFFGADFNPTVENVKRSRIGFDYLKLAFEEKLNMDAEGILLKAYTEPTSQCETLISEFRLKESAEKYRVQVQDTIDMITKFRVEVQCCTETSPDQVFDSGLVNGDEIQIIGGRLDGVSADDLLEKYRTEMEHDIRFVSFPSQFSIDFLDGYAERTLEMCQALRTDPEFRLQFETDTILSDDTTP